MEWSSSTHRAGHLRERREREDDDPSTSLGGWRGWMHKEMPCSTVSISVTHLQFRNHDFTILSSAFCTLHKERKHVRCCFHSPEAVSYAQETFNKCFNWSASAFSSSWLISKSPCQTYVIHYISELYRFESRDENKTIFSQWNRRHSGQFCVMKRVKVHQLLGLSSKWR